MGRPREFDIGQAVDRAMNVFWAKGYEASSLQDLLAAMGIARGSLYKAFQDKRSIYLAALELYDATVVQQAVEMLRNAELGDGARRVRMLFEAAVRAIAERNDRRGCLLCNAAVDQAPVDAEIRARVLAMMKRLDRAIGLALKDSRRAGRWSTHRRSRAATALVNAYLGLRVLARSGYPVAELTAVIDASLEGFGLGPPSSGRGRDVPS